MTIDLLIVGPLSEAILSWPQGQVIHGGTSPAALCETLDAWLATTEAEGLLCWDTRLGAPDPALAVRLLAGRGDVWHAGLRLGLGGQPGLIDFVAPNWMLNCDPPKHRDATSWRAALAACLVRTEVFRQLGLPRPEFDTVTGAVLEWAHRAILRGAIVRHVPSMVPTGTTFVCAPPTIVDEVRFVVYRYGRSWARWVVARAGMSGYANVTDLARAMHVVRGPRPYADPAAYRSTRSLGTPDLAHVRVTVLIPTLNRYPYLHVVLANLRTQTVRPHEIIIVDQSPRAQRDPTIAANFGDLPLRLMYLDSPGQCSSRNAGLHASTGDFILFIDDDDELPADLIERHLITMFKYDADVASGVDVEVGTAPLPEERRFTRSSDVFPTNNTLVRRDVLHRSGLFDLAFDRAPRADGELGMRVYCSGAFMVIDQSNAVMHHHASEGGLRTHRARVITYRMSREQLTSRHLPHISEIYLMSRHFTPRQQRETLWLRTFGTLSGRGGPVRRFAKVLIGGAQLLNTVREIAKRRHASAEWLQKFPQIDELPR